MPSISTRQPPRHNGCTGIADLADTVPARVPRVDLEAVTGSYRVMTGRGHDSSRSSSGPSGVRQQFSSHSAAATSAAAQTAPIDAVSVSEAAEVS